MNVCVNCILTQTILFFHLNSIVPWWPTLLFTISGMNRPYMKNSKQFQRVRWLYGIAMSLVLVSSAPETRCYGRGAQPLIEITITFSQIMDV